MKSFGLLLTIALSLTGGRAESAPRLLARFGFDEGRGGCANDSVNGREAMLSPSAKWALGAFGAALATGERGASATLEPIKGLAGADACSLAVRVRKTGKGSGSYPCVLSTTGWASGKGRGGVMLFSAGDDLTVRLRADDGQEGSFAATEKMPENRWMSVVVTFARPVVKVYVDGKHVTTGSWDHPFAVGGNLVLGGHEDSSFGGFVDDFRVWSAAIGDAEVAEYASDAGYEEVEGYQDDGTGGIRKTELRGQEGEPTVTLKGREATLVLDDLGAIISLKENASGRELVAWTGPFVSFRDRKGVLRIPCRMESRGADRLAFAFPGGRGEVVLAVKPFDGGWSFTVEKSTLPSCRVLSLGCIHPACTNYNGGFANALSDDRSAVCVRSYGLNGNPRAEDGLCVEVGAPLAAEGLSFGLAAGPREGFREQLKAMTVAAKVPRSDCGGAWSMGSDQSRRSYVFASVRKGDIDYWIDFVKRGGFSIIHLWSSWTDCLGPYPISKREFPGGLDEMKAAARKVHDAGLQIGIHTLTACIEMNAPWLHPVCDSNLVADATYTLAAPLAPDATELVVEERPIGRHSTVYTYSSNGNIMRLGGELIQYTGIRRGKPYAFTGLKRGAFGTRKTEGTVPAGAKVDYVHQRYCALYPAPDSPLADRLADRLAEVYNTCELDELYFDGSEGMGSRYGIDVMRHKIYSRLHHNNGHSPSIEASCKGANNWWFQTRTMTTDHAVWGMKRFHDWHLGVGIDGGRNANFLEPQMGWWSPRTDVPRARGHFPDEMEYFAAKNAGHDAAMAVQGVHARPLPIVLRRQLTILGWYEHARLARALTPENVAYLAQPRTESRLRQAEDGTWNLTEVESLVHRAGFPWERAWTIAGGTERPAALRVEALYAAAEEKSGVPVLGADGFAGLETRSADGVKVSFEPKTADGAHGPAFRLSAANDGAPRKGSWASAKKAFAFPGLDLGEKRLAFGVWVKGDGSGALLDFQFTTPGEFGGGVSDHFVRLDFTGWKYVTVLLRERDAARRPSYEWPSELGYAATYRNFVDPRHLDSVSVLLNDVASGGRTTVEVGEIHALEQVPAKFENAAVTVNGASVVVPFAMTSGEYAELEADGWTHYSAMGEKLAVAGATALPKLAAGENAVALDAPEGARAEVTLFALGATRPAFVDDLTDVMRRELRYEGLMPFEYAPSKRFLPPKTIPVRPGETAKLSLEIYGPCESPTFSFRKFFGLSTTVCAFETSVAKNEKLVCRNGIDWRVEKAADGALVKEGRLAEPLPRLSGSQPFAFTAKVPDDGVCTVDLMKDYGP